MYNNLSIDTIDNVRSYATQATAQAAVDKAFKEVHVSNNPGGRRAFNVLFVFNSAGRIAPLIVNVNADDFHWVIHRGFMTVN